MLISLTIFVFGAIMFGMVLKQHIHVEKSIWVRYLVSTIGAGFIIFLFWIVPDGVVPSVIYYGMSALCGLIGIATVMVSIHYYLKEV